MRKILICILDNGRELEQRNRRGEELAAMLSHSAILCTVDVVHVAPGVALGLLARTPDAIVAVGYGPAELPVLRQIACPIVWDMQHITDVGVAELLDGEATSDALRRALASAAAFVDVPEAVALVIEDRLSVGLSSHDIPAALAAAMKRIVVIVGAGLGNMIYAGPMLRWLSERTKAPIDVVIHNRFDAAVPLFSRAPWLNAVYPGFEYLVGRRYWCAISSITAGAVRPPFSAEHMLWIDGQRDYNVEGRFIHETRLNFLDLEQVFDETPSLLSDLPPPFIRDFNYVHPGNRVIGVASGKKEGNWSNREWPHMPALVQRLLGDGWEVRSFGLPGEHVDGAEDFTGLPVREALTRMSECSYFISYDGGICHMAEAIGIPTIWLFGPTSLVKNGPYYSHSPALLSRRGCGPCIYKADWIRCTQPDCMEDIGIDDVLRTLGELCAEIKTAGYAPRRAEENTDLLRYEVEALFRPGPAAQRRRAQKERTALTCWNVEALESLALRLLGGGDLAGAMAIIDALTSLHPDSVVGRVLSAVVGQAFPGPSMMQGLTQTRHTRIDHADLSGLFEALAERELPLEQRGVLLLAVTRFLACAGDRAGARIVLQSALKSRRLMRAYSGRIRHLRSLMDDHVANGEQVEGDADFLDAAAQRMKVVMTDSVGARLNAHAENLASLLDMTGERVRKAAFTPHREMVQNSLSHRELVPLQLGQKTLGLHHHDVVLVLTPHVRVKNAPPGSTSNLILQHVTRLAMIGLRPVVVSVGYDDIPDGVTMRDSVTYIQGHRRWKPDNWGAVADCFAPTLAFAYGGIERQLELPDGLRSRIVSMSLEGLFDADGLIGDAPANECWSPGEASADGQGGDSAYSADALSSTLFIEPERRATTPPAPISVNVLLNDARDFLPLLTVITAMPAVHFTVQTALRHRGIEKNLRTVLPGVKLEDSRNEPSILLQFSTKPTVLAAECIAWAEKGRGLVAATTLQIDGALASRVQQVRTPDNPGAWIRAVQAEAQALKVRHSMLLHD